jgi:hypothetical protein
MEKEENLKDYLVMGIHVDIVDTHQNQSQYQSYFTTDSLPPVSSSWRQAPWDSRPAFFPTNTCFHSPYVTTSLMIGRFCSLQLLQTLSRVVIHRSESREIRDHILLWWIRDSPNLEGQAPVFVSPRNGVAQLIPPRHWVPFSSPPTARRNRVELVDPWYSTLF